MTPSPNYADKAMLATDPIFIGRVRQALIAHAMDVSRVINDIVDAAGDTTITAFARNRDGFSIAVLASPDTYKVAFTYSVCDDSAVINDATDDGTVTLDPGNVASQAQHVTDPHILAAVAAQFNTYIRST